MQPSQQNLTNPVPASQTLNTMSTMSASLHDLRRPSPQTPVASPQQFRDTNSNSPFPPLAAAPSPGHFPSYPATKDKRFEELILKEHSLGQDTYAMLVQVLFDRLTFSLV